MSETLLPPLRAPAQRPQSLEASHFWPSQHFCLSLHYSWQVCFPLPPLAPTSAPSLQWLLCLSVHPSISCLPPYQRPLPLISIPSPISAPSI